MSLYTNACVCVCVCFENNVIEYQTERDSDYVLNSMHVHVAPCVFIAANLCEFKNQLVEKKRLHQKSIWYLKQKKEQKSEEFEHLIVVTKAKNFP